MNVCLFLFCCFANWEWWHHKRIWTLLTLRRLMATNSTDRPHSAGLVMIQMWILLYEINLLIKRFSLTRRTGSTINLSANYSPVHELRCNLQNTIKWFNIKQLFVVGQKTNSRALLPISIEDEVNNCFSIIILIWSSGRKKVAASNLSFHTV